MAFSFACTVPLTASADPIVQNQKVNTQKVDVVGEVVDTWCYASKSVGDGRGLSHKKCAETCIMGGVSAGIVDDKGNLYVAAKTKAYTGANRLLLPFVAKKVVAHGWVSRSGGTQLLKIDSVEEWKPGMKTGHEKAKAAVDPKEVDAIVKHLSERESKATPVWRLRDPKVSK
jgi:hypothetical protein